MKTELICQNGPSMIHITLLKNDIEVVRIRRSFLSDNVYSIHRIGSWSVNPKYQGRPIITRLELVSMIQSVSQMATNSAIERILSHPIKLWRNGVQESSKPSPSPPKTESFS